MIIENLLKLENRIMDRLEEYHRNQTADGADELLWSIIDENKKIYCGYALLSATNYEAMKRGLFLSWYSISEPNWISGICELNIRDEEVIMRAVDLTFASKGEDYELKWMLGYYSSWEYIFDRFSSCENLQQELKNPSIRKLPRTISREDMEVRGQMGAYWNSLNCFK